MLRLLSWSCGVPGSDVEDVAQLVWLQVHKLGPPPEAPRAWITTLARNVVANERRKAGRRRDEPWAAVPVDLVGPGLTVEELLSLRACLTRLLEAVPNPDQREALFLAAEGLSAAEIGRIQGVTPACARQRVHLARQQIRQAAAAGGEEGSRSRTARCLPLLAVGLEDFLKPLPAEELDRQWNDIESAIQRHEGAPQDGQPPSLPPPVAVPSVPAPGPVPPGWLPLAPPKLVVPFVGALLGGAVAGWFPAPAPAPGRDPSAGIPLIAPGSVATLARQVDAPAPSPPASTLASCRELSAMGVSSAAPHPPAVPARKVDAPASPAAAPAAAGAHGKQLSSRQAVPTLAGPDDLDRRARAQAERWSGVRGHRGLDLP